MFENTAGTGSFGTVLKQWRKRQRLTQHRLAEALGVHHNTIGRWEEGSFLPESKALVLCILLNFSRAWNTLRLRLWLAGMLFGHPGRDLDLTSIFPTLPYFCGSYMHKYFMLNIALSYQKGGLLL
jgi:transcriptional regulator with XRE-family HTH domain